MAVMFTGHREVREKDRTALYRFVREEVSKAYHQGERTFYVGMARGFDMLVATILQTMRDVDGDMFGDLHIVAVVPFKGQADRWARHEQKLWSYLTELADERVFLQDYYTKGVFLRRNDYMVQHSQKVIAYYNGKVHSGTGYTVRKALQRGLEVVNFYDTKENL